MTIVLTVLTVMSLGPCAMGVIMPMTMTVTVLMVIVSVVVVVIVVVAGVVIS